MLLLLEGTSETWFNAFILEMWKLRPEKGKLLAQSHMVKQMAQLRWKGSACCLCNIFPNSWP